MKIQIDIPDDLNKQIAIYSIENDLNDKRKAIIELLYKQMELKK